MRIALSLAFIASLATVANASSLVPTVGGPLNQSFNLLTDGSFESGYTTQHYWATGTTLTPYAPVPGWTSNGDFAAYAAREDVSNFPAGSDGAAALYFGNQFCSYISETPAFLPNGVVSFINPVTILPKGPGYQPSVTLSQTVSGLNTTHKYGLSFWTTGEGLVNGSFTFGHDGIFGLDLTGFNTTYLAAPDAAANSVFGADTHTFYFEFIPSASTSTLTFTNWGHFAPFTTNWTLPTATNELVLDNVILNDLGPAGEIAPEPASMALLGIGSAFLLRRRSHNPTS